MKRPWFIGLTVLILNVGFPVTCKSFDNQLAASQELTGLYAYPSPTEDFPASPFYRMSVLKDGMKQSAFIYMSKARTEGPGTEYVSGRTLSYTGFMATGVVTVEVELLENDSIEPGPVTIKPSRFGIEPVSVNQRTVRFELSHEGQFTLEFGAMGYRHGLVIAYDPWETGRPDPDNPAVLCLEGGSKGDPTKKAQDVHTIFFKRGTHEMGGRIDLPQNIREVYLEPGAFVYGAIYTEHPDVQIHGRGVLSSERMAHREAHSIETPPQAKCVVIDGLFVTDYPMYAIRTLGRDNVVRWVKCVGGWIYNADGLVAWSGTTLRNNFIHADDDAIKLYDDNVLVENCVIWQMTNGACLQLGWGSLAANRVRVRNIDVVRVEWRHVGQANNSVINLRLPGSRSANTQSDFLFENIFVETPVDRVIDLRFKDKRIRDQGRRDGGPHYLRGFLFKNIHAQMTDPPNEFTGNYFLPWDTEHGYENIIFEDLFINGVRITEENYEGTGQFSIPPEAKNEISFF